MVTSRVISTWEEITMSEAHRAAIRRVYEEVWNQGNLAVVDELLAPDYIGHIPPETLTGPEGYKQFVTRYRTVFPDLHFTVADVVAEGDRVVSRWTCRATHQGELEGIAATGMQVRSTGMSIARFSAGKMVEYWANWDALGLMQQLGATPDSPQGKGEAAG